MNTEDNMPIPISSKASSAPIEAKIIEFIVRENKAFFRSQQINDPELTDKEKRSIVEAVLNDSHKKFLFRFGDFIADEHLAYFESIESPSPEDNYEIKYLIKELRKKISDRTKIIKNRRYAALQKMINENNYFTEKEMMSREPLLYDHLIGQYMTETERKVRDNLDLDPNEMFFSDVLMEGIFKRQVDDLRKKQELDEAEDELCENMDETDLNCEHDDQVFPQIPPSYRQHWGDFDDEPCSSEGIKRLDSTQQYITGDERDLLKKEFYGIMFSNFVSGNDSDFDYKTVDDNPEFDNIEQQNRDEEDKYFDAHDDDDDDDGEIEQRRIKDNYSNSSEDELDVYMKQINNETKT